MILVIYRYVVIPLVSLFIRLFKHFNEKLNERETNWKKVLQDLSSKQTNAPTIWFHASSMGEFEQAKPVIEYIKNKYTCSIVASFYSPSGFNNQRQYSYVDKVLYMPFDTKNNATLFINTIKPSVAVFVRYDVWLNHLDVLKKKNIPCLLICATIPNSQLFRKCWLLKPYLRLSYNYFSEIITIGEEHSDFFKALKLHGAVNTQSDTRFDRVLSSVEKAKAAPVLAKINKSKIKTLVAGSTWQEDEEIIISAIKRINNKNSRNVRLVLVPHEPNESNIKRIKSQSEDSVLLSQLLKNNSGTSENESFDKHIIVDSIGLLLRLYGNADYAYIGGGFGAGVHSIAEPAGYGIPLATGPKYHVSNEARHLVTLNALEIINNADEFYDWLSNMLDNEAESNRIGRVCREFIEKNSGTSSIIGEKIVGYLKEKP